MALGHETAACTTCRGLHNSISRTSLAQKALADLCRTACKFAAASVGNTVDKALP